MPKKKIVIKDGVIAGFDDELAEMNISSDNKDKRRVSHIRPENRMLRTVFVIIRKGFADDSKVVEWMRGWRVLWQVEIEGKIYKGFSDRLKAIEFEKSKIDIEKYI